jgi:hypothetical protein
MIIDMLVGNPDITGDPELVRVLDEMRDAGLASSESCSHVSMIIKSLKNFSRLDQADFQEANINESAKSVVLLTRFLWKNRIEMHEDYGSLPYVKCYPGLLNQVFMNLVVNAIRSIRDKGDVYIRTWSDDKNVYASIRDNGVGISKRSLPACLKTTLFSRVDKGQGMGLSICKSIIDKHHGTIEAEAGWERAQSSFSACRFNKDVCNDRGCSLQQLVLLNPSRIQAALASLSQRSFKLQAGTPLNSDLHTRRKNHPLSTEHFRIKQNSLSAS